MSHAVSYFTLVESIVGHVENPNPKRWKFQIKWIGDNKLSLEDLDEYFDNETAPPVIDMLIAYVNRTFKGMKKLYIENVDGTKVYSVEDVAEVRKQVNDGRLRLVKDVMNPSDPKAKRLEFNELLDHKFEDGYDQFLVWWTGSRLMQSTWEPLKHVVGTDWSREAVVELLYQKYGVAKVLTAVENKRGTVVGYTIVENY